MIGPNLYLWPMNYTLKALVTIMAASVLVFTLPNCSNQSKSDQGVEKQKDKSGPEYTSAYICPMHCAGSGSDKPGECPICGMKYRENKDHQAHQEEAEAREEAVESDTSQGEDHSGHDHE